MPAQYHINHEDEFVAIQLEGDVDLVEVYELCQSLLSDPAFNPQLPQLADVRNVNLKVTPGAIRPFLNYVTTKYRPRVAGESPWCSTVRWTTTSVPACFASSATCPTRKSSTTTRSRSNGCCVKAGFSRRYRNHKMPAEIRLTNIQNRYGLE